MHSSEKVCGGGGGGDPRDGGVTGAWLAPPWAWRSRHLNVIGGAGGAGGGARGAGPARRGRGAAPHKGGGSVRCGCSAPRAPGPRHPPDTPPAFPWHPPDPPPATLPASPPARGSGTRHREQQKRQVWAAVDRDIGSRPAGTGRRTAGSGSYRGGAGYGESGSREPSRRDLRVSSHRDRPTSTGHGRVDPWEPSRQHRARQIRPPGVIQAGPECIQSPGVVQAAPGTADPAVGAIQAASGTADPDGRTGCPAGHRAR